MAAVVSGYEAVRDRGVTVVTGRREHDKNYGRHESRVTCSHSDCGHTGKTYSCHFCHKQYCKFHIKPHVPGAQYTKGHDCGTYSKLNKRQEERPMRQEQTREERPAHVFSHMKKSKKIIILVACAILAIIVLGVFIIPIEKQTIPELTQTTETTTVQEETYTKADFGEYVLNFDKYVGTKVTVQGYLWRKLEGTKTSGRYIDEVIDDKKNEIELSKLTLDQAKLLGDTKSTIIYEVTGILRRPYIKKVLEVESINEATLTPIITTKNITRNVTKETGNVTVKTKTLFQKLISSVDCENETKNGQCSEQKPDYCSFGTLVAKPEKCGCPEGEREYDGECIKIVTCTDGTLAPECSKNKPLLCDNGALISKATECGCPEDNRKIGDNCQKIMRCADKTEYGECSSSKPSYCEDGRLIDRAEKCGCPWREYEHSGECVDKITKIEFEIYRLTNEQRTQNGLPALKWNQALERIARDHSEDMVNRDFFDHVNPDGEDPTDRAKRHGFNVHKNLGGGWYSDGIAENINIMPTGDVVGRGYVSSDPASIADASVDGWMESPGHRANILNSQYTEIGVGIADGSKGYYGTQNFY